MLRYAITDRKFYGGNRADQVDSLVQQTHRWAADGIDFVQLREKDLTAAELADLTRKMVSAARQVNGRTRVLVNSRAEVALAAGADGVHLTAAAGELNPAQVRELFRRAERTEPVLSISCHTLDEVRRASRAEVDAILFGPVFGKESDGVAVIDGVGLEALRTACAAAGDTKVLALGGITTDLAMECVAVGAAGVAGIRLFRNFSYQ